MNCKPLSVSLVFVLASLAAACNKSSTNSVPPSTATADSGGTSEPRAPRTDQEAIQDAIQQHLRDNKGINMSAMEMNFSKAEVKGDQAQANVEFRLKQNGTSMLITYFLERHADGWIVVRNQPNGSGQFAHPPMDKTHSTAASPAFPDVTGFLKRKEAEKSSSGGATRQQ